MALSVKLGIASLLLVVGSVVSFLMWSELPIGPVCAVISCVLGILAAHRGSKLWLVIPCTAMAFLAFLLHVGFQAN